MDDLAADGPLVTAVIPAFNSQSTIERALQSALDQTYRPLEIVVVDDCSRDRTAGIVAEYAGRGVRLLRTDHQRGASGARNAGVAAARGDLIAFLDSDDEWMPLKLEKQVKLILSDSAIVFVSCAAREYSPLGEDCGDLYGGGRPIEGPECWKSLLARNTIATPSVLVWRKRLLETGGFDENLDVGEDQDMWIRLAARGSVAYVDEWLVRVNTRVNSLSSNLGLAKLRMVVGVVERHIAREGTRLVASEVRRIRAERLAWLGRAECNTSWLEGVPSMARSAFMGYRPFQTVQFLASASPPSRWLKARLFSRPELRRPQRAGPAPVRGLSRHSQRPWHPMLAADQSALVRFPLHERPRLVVIVDAEEEFDWRAPLSRENRSVGAMAAQSRAHEIYRRYAVIPTYAVDYPVVTEEAGYRPLLELLGQGACDIGAQLHSWTTPPFEEEVCDENSFAGNLPASLERRKLETLVQAIERRFGSRPRLYRAGRYGTGRDTAAILESLGFDTDCSVVPGVSRWSSHAPNYAGGSAHPYWLATRRPLLELPVTVASIGPARHLGEEFYRKLQTGPWSRLRIAGLLARSGLLNRVRLSPEGSSLAECKHLTNWMLARGYRYFSVSYHSPSLEPGHTPYVRDARELERFLAWIEGYLAFFFEELNGVADTPAGIYRWARSLIPRVEPRARLRGMFADPPVKRLAGMVRPPD